MDGAPEEPLDVVDSPAHRSYSMSQDHKAHLELLTNEASPPPEKQRRLAGAHSSGSPQFKDSEGSSAGQLGNSIDASEPPPGMFKPGTTFLLAWSYIIMLVSIYNSITIPYRMTFWDTPIDMKPDVWLLLAFDALGDICFFVEIYLAFHTGYVDTNGVIVWDTKLIRKRYLHSWFILDAVSSSLHTFKTHTRLCVGSG
jgi:hypothetical protein